MMKQHCLYRIRRICEIILSICRSYSERMVLILKSGSPMLSNSSFLNLSVCAACLVSWDESSNSSPALICKSLSQIKKSTCLDLIYPLYFPIFFVPVTDIKSSRRTLGHIRSPFFVHFSSNIL